MDIEENKKELEYDLVRCRDDDERQNLIDAIYAKGLALYYGLIDDF